jgi:NAD(P)-dependent dehydrogenase (short-subunit alcohol dehydrogenase family)
VQLRDQVALVTGGASGLGNATARALHEAGAHVLLLDLPTSEGAAAATAVGERARFVPTDVADPDQVAEAVAQAGELGDLRVAVNCAGVAWAGRVVGRDGPHDLDLFRKVVEINLIGTFNVVRLAAAAMAGLEPLQGDRGVIVNTASIAAFDGQVGQAAYARRRAASSASRCRSPVTWPGRPSVCSRSRPGPSTRPCWPVCRRTRGTPWPRTSPTRTGSATRPSSGCSRGS